MSRPRLPQAAVAAGLLSAAALAGASAGAHAGVARVQSEQRPVGCPARHFLAEYFDNVDLVGRPFLTECVERVDFDWGHGRAHPRVPENYFGVRWSADLVLEAGTYRFGASTDDGARLYVDGQLVIDAWYQRAERTSTAYGYLTAGSHHVVLEYFEHGGVAAAHLTWERSDSGWFQVGDRARR